MSQDPPIPRQESRLDQDAEPGEVATVEWGETEPGRRSRSTRWLTGIGQDHRLVPVLAGLGVAGVIASLVGEWSVTTVPNAGANGEAVRLPGGVADVANFGAGYLIGLLGVIGSIALVLFGAPASRHNARVLGLALTGGVLVLLVAATTALDQGTERLLFGASEGLQIAYGRGLTMAFLGTAALGLALLLAGRFVQPPPTAIATGATAAAPPASGAPTSGTPATDAELPADGPGDWPWRRPGAGRGQSTDLGQHDDRPAPTDLTVGPATPFAHPDRPDDR
ncbi:hypothetical protein O7627_00175 [Solwaraspora sp. WMMD1047]|uniref:hypothetical protein n=1 Tax=Solwaraspora sp. WMMD1047 TaxID=3016102 RepID=UPI002417D62C|nr:hypothetical protein [Solwaraspora sp. WMMD1047]MDG4827719.1 hypothetical protein [Solwaraspora sp. WMMD1047]